MILIKSIESWDEFFMKTKDVALYIEHKWVKKYTIPTNRSYILIAYIAYGQGIVKIENREI